MEERVERLERALADLGRRLEQTTRRVEELEGRASGAGARSTTRDSGAVDPVAPDSADFIAVLSLTGRACLVLGGAYLLRALTDAAWLPRAAGTALGFAYAMAWLVAALRSVGARGGTRAAFHATTAVLIAFPLVWESTVRVQLLSEAAAAGAMGAITAAGLAVAWRRREQALAWVVTCAGIVAGLSLIAAVGTGQIDPATGERAVTGSSAAVTGYFAFLGVVTLWFGYQLDWTWLRWPVAIVVDGAVALMAWNATGAWQRDQAGAVMLVQLALFAGYLVSFAARTLWRSRRVVPFEVVQTIILLAVCFGGAVYLMSATGSNAAALGFASLAFAAGSYAAAFAFVDWRGAHWTNFVFYASLGLVLAVAGTAIVAAPPLQAVVWSLLAVGAAAGGRHYKTVTLGAHAALYAIAAALSSGLLVHAADALVAPASVAWSPLHASGTVALAAAALSSAVVSDGTNESWGRLSRVPKVALVLFLLWSAGGTACGLLAPLAAGIPGSAVADPALVASVRTAVLSAAAVLLAWLGRAAFVEGRWLTYVVLVATGLKLLVEDFPNGRPATLFLSLAVYGVALIVGPRIRAGAASARRPAARAEPV